MGLNSPHITALPATECEKETGLHSKVESPNVKLCHADDGDGHLDESGEPSLPCITHHTSTSSSDNDLEIGQVIGIDNAIAEYQKNAFPVLTSAPVTNFAQQLRMKQGNTEQSAQSALRLPTLLDN